MVPPEPGIHPLLPAESLRCVWMEAGLLAWHLCDRRLECEGCPLDEALRSPQGAQGDGPLPFPGDRRYHPAHLWLLTLGPARVRVGLDAFAAEVLPPPAEVEVAEVGSQLPPHGILAVLQLPQGRLVVETPVGGRVEGANQTLAEDPAALLSAPYATGWLVELTLRRGEADPLLFTGEEMRRLTEVHRLRFRRALAMRLHRRPALAGLPADPEDGAGWIGLVRQLLR